MEHILAKYPDTPTFLAANSSVTDFYPRFGFCKVQTYRPVIAVELHNNVENPIKRLPEDKQVTNALLGRSTFSTALDSLNTQMVQMFHLLLDYSESIYDLPNCGAIVIAEQEGDRLFIADVIATKQLAFDEILQELPFMGVHCIEFGFCPDWLGVSAEWIPENMEENPCFIRGAWNLPHQFRFPAMSET